MQLRCGLPSSYCNGAGYMMYMPLKQQGIQLVILSELDGHEGTSRKNIVSSCLAPALLWLPR